MRTSFGGIRAVPHFAVVPLFVVVPFLGCATTEEKPSPATSDQGAVVPDADEGQAEQAGALDPERKALEDELLALLETSPMNAAPPARLVDVASAVHGERVGPKDVVKVGGSVLAARVKRMPADQQRAWMVETLRQVGAAKDAPSPMVAARFEALGLAAPKDATGNVDGEYLLSLAEEADPEFAAKLRSFQCRSKQSEARTCLKSLYVSEEAYRAEHDTYHADLDTIGFNTHGDVIRYDYEVVEATATSFKAVARGKPEHMPGDEWTIDQDNRMVNTQAGCPASPTP